MLARALQLPPGQGAVYYGCSDKTIKLNARRTHRIRRDRAILICTLTLCIRPVIVSCRGLSATRARRADVRLAAAIGQSAEKRTADKHHCQGQSENQSFGHFDLPAIQMFIVPNVATERNSSMKSAKKNVNLHCRIVNRRHSRTFRQNQGDQTIKTFHPEQGTEINGTAVTTAGVDARPHEEAASALENYSNHCCTFLKSLS